MEKIIFNNLFMLCLRDLIKLSGKKGGQEHNIFIPLCNYMSKSALCFLARHIFISSTCHSSPSFAKVRNCFTFRREVGGTWQNWEVSFQCVCHADVQKLKNEDIFDCVIYFSVWEPACMWVFVLQLFWGSAPTRIQLFCRYYTELLEKSIGEL